MESSRTLDGFRFISSNQSPDWGKTFDQRERKRSRLLETTWRPGNRKDGIFHETLPLSFSLSLSFGNTDTSNLFLIKRGLFIYFCSMQIFISLGMLTLCAPNLFLHGRTNNSTRFHPFGEFLG